MHNTSGYPQKRRKRSPGETRGAGGGPRNIWSKRKGGSEYAQHHFELRKKRQEAKRIANAGERVREAARVVLEDTYGAKLPALRGDPVENNPVAPEISPNVLTSKNPRELMQDLELLAKASKEQWPVDPTTKAAVVARLQKLLVNQDLRPELVLAVAKAFATLDTNNLRWIQMARPQQVEHTHVAVESPPIEQRRARLLEILSRNSERGGGEGPRRIDGPDDDGECIDVGK